MKTKKFLIIVLSAVCIALSGCGKSEEVKNVEKLISNISMTDVTSLDDQQAEKDINAAYEAYIMLSAKDKEKVSNYNDLTNAQITLLENYIEYFNKNCSRIDDIDKISVKVHLSSLYENINSSEKDKSESIKAFMTACDKSQAVINKIHDIDVSASASTLERQVDEAEKAYNALSSYEKQFVTNKYLLDSSKDMAKNKNLLDTIGGILGYN